MAESAESWFAALPARPGAWENNTGEGSFYRLWRAFMAARITIAAVLVVLQVSIYALGNLANAWVIAGCVFYLAATVVVHGWGRPKAITGSFDARWLATIGIDVIAFSALHFFQSGGMNYTPLFALPVLLAAILGPIVLALGTAASVTLFLLADAWWISFVSSIDSTSRFLQAGLSGTGFFAVAILANQLALRLVREEKQARVSQSVARMQTQVNQLVIETLSDGVLVIDGNGIVRSANPAARRLLATEGSSRTAPFVLGTEAAWKPLQEITRRTFASGQAQLADVSLDYAARSARRLHVKTRLALSKTASQESLCVMFLEDLREMEARVRTEKMAAMGRMSAAVAHEIRNPLAAISQANALLDEDLQQPEHRQLTRMIGQNALRLAKIVDDILNISRVKVLTPEQQGSAIMLDEVLARICTDWAAQTGSEKALATGLSAAQACVVFDPEHLRRLMINLLDNALRYASNGNGSIAVWSRQTESDRAQLGVWSDGPPLEKTVQAHLFEPFFSSESRSSGLGLYICRELCERYGASVGYRRTVQGEVDGNEFFVVFKVAGVPGDAAQSESQAQLFFASALPQADSSKSL